MAGDENIFNGFSCNDPRHISPKETVFLSEDETNVSTNGKDATVCCNPGNSAPKQPQSQ